MTIGLTRKSVSALARLDLSGMSHMQRIDAIARVFGHENNASLMSALKAEEKGSAAGLATPAAKGAVVITAFGDRLSSCISAGYPVDADTEGDIVERRFGSEAEASAYLSGVEDATGWLESEFAAVKGREPSTATRNSLRNSS